MAQTLWERDIYTSVKPFQLKKLINETQHRAKSPANMHFVTTICALLPALASAMPEVMGEAIAMTPTMEDFSRVYPDVRIDAIAGANSSDLVSRDDFDTNAAEIRNIGYRIVAGSLTAIGYYSINVTGQSGCTQIEAAQDACNDVDGNGNKCWGRIVAASCSHLLVFGAGFVGGRQAVHYFWHNGVLQAAGLAGAAGARKRAACNTNQSTWQSGRGIHFNGQYGMKMASKNMHCYSPDAGELGYVSALGSMIGLGMSDPKHCSLSTQYTIYKTSTNIVLARYHAEADSVRTDVCPFDISGGDGCTV
ncbi:hypothetical protein PRZ48_011697 [Zasmidium cellare]|uniref:Uncharacterized protein n=1 Tax=Zasmidium cellare TaxID=395010 RepID=A0ABR0E740_ZASCE|nr:hypothetical protein PRZ48_011697 [Zasmidium cellare]